MTQESNEQQLGQGERDALDAAWSGTPPAPGDLTRESPYEQERQRGQGKPYEIDSSSRDKADGPTHQPGALPGYVPARGQPTGYEPFRSPIERNETDLDLRTNRAPDGDPFDSQEATEGEPIPPGAPHAANRELEKRPGT
jgi:hypothetical protein